MCRGAATNTTYVCLQGIRENHGKRDEYTDLKPSDVHRGIKATHTSLTAFDSRHLTADVPHKTAHELSCESRKDVDLTHQGSHQDEGT